MLYHSTTLRMVLLKFEHFARIRRIAIARYTLRIEDVLAVLRALSSILANKNSNDSPKLSHRYKVSFT